MKKLYIFGLVLLCSYINEALVVPNGQNLTANEQEFILQAFNQMLQNDTKSGSSEKLQQSFSSQSTVQATFSSGVYTDMSCKSPKFMANKDYTEAGIIEDNTITYPSTQPQGHSMLGKMIISSILPDLQGFQVFLSSSKHNDQLDFLFSGNQIRCHIGSMTFNVRTMIVQICVESVNMTRGKGTISSCFLAGATTLWSRYVDINTINVINEMRTVVVDVGCYSATGNDIRYQGQNPDRAKNIVNMMKTIVKPLHNEMCNHSDRNMPTILITLIAITIVLSNHF